MLGKTRKIDFRRDAKVLLFDLEVSPTNMWGYGQYDVRPIKVDRAPVLLSFAWKWLGDSGKPECLTMLDRPSANRFDSTALAKELWKVMDEAETIVGHNVRKFDEKMANTFFVRAGLNPPSNYTIVDTLTEARKYFKFDNNKLDYLGELLGCGRKTKITHADAWEDLLLGEGKARKKASDLMKKYNIQDVVLLEKIYYKLQPFARNRPNMALNAFNAHICPRCGFDADFKVKAYRKTGVQINGVQYQCQHCGGYVTRPLTPEERAEFKDEDKLKTHFRNI